jgi:acetyl-CoA carboxylase biotin carboxyl carrier protein
VLVDAKKLKAIVEILDGTDISFVEWRKADERWTIRRGGGDGAATVVAQPMIAQAPATMPAAAAQAPAAGGGEPGAPAGASAPRPGVSRVASPFVGTFYRAASPDSAPFVEVGDSVQKGQTLCIIEAMKLMNEIEAEVSGRIVGILAENGQAVEYGEPLFEIEAG